MDDPFEAIHRQHGLNADGTKADVDLYALAAIELAGPEGFTPCTPGVEPCRIGPGDRLWVYVEAAGRHVYAIGVRQQRVYRRLHAAAPASSGLHLWPSGLVLDADTSDMDALLVVASTDPLPWAASLSTTDCGHLVGQPPPDDPSEPCEHLYGLFWKIPPAVRGMVTPPQGTLEVDGRELPAQKGVHDGSPYTAVQFQFKPR